MKNPSDEHKQAAEKPARRPYQRPEILSAEKLEFVAAVCTQPTAKGDPIACPQGPLSS